MAETTNPMRERPLSPHLDIYRWTWTMAMSVLHRVPGAALYGGMILLAIWLVAAASGRASYEAADWIVSSWIGRLVLLGYTWALMHHLFGGLRHFIWDFARAFDAASRLKLARATLLLSGATTLLIWIVAYALR